MSGYAALLEDYYNEQKLANDTFTGISECLESLTSMVNEEVEFGVMITLQEAEEGAIKDKAGKIASSVKRTAEALVKRLIAFVGKIGEAIKRFVAKAKVIIAQKGNQAMAKILSNREAMVDGEVKLKVPKDWPAIHNIYKKALSTANDINKDMTTACDAVKGSKDLSATAPLAKNSEKYAPVIDALSEDIASSDQFTDKVYGDSSASRSVKDAYHTYIEPGLGVINKNISEIEKVCNDAKKKCDETAKAIKAATTKENDKYYISSVIADVTKTSSQCMRISTYILNFSMSLLANCAKNSAKLALAAVDSKKNRLVAAGKEKSEAKKAEREAKKAEKEAEKAKKEKEKK